MRQGSIPVALHLEYYGVSFDICPRPTQRHSDGLASPVYSNTLRPQLSEGTDCLPPSLN